MDFTGPWPTVGAVGTAHWLSHIAMLVGGQFDMNATKLGTWPVICSRRM